LTGIGMLIRPMAILLPFVLCGVIMARAKHLTRATRAVACALFLIATAATIAPWEGWAHARSGHWILLSTNGPPSMKDGLTFAVDPRPYRQGISVPDDVRQFMLGIYAKRMVNVGEVAKAVAHEASLRPAAFVKLGFIKLARAWYGTDSQRMEMPLLLVQVVYLTILVAATWVAWRVGGAARDLAALTALVVLYFWFMNLSSLPLARYTTPAVSLLFALLPAVLPHRLRGTPIASSGERP